MPVWTRGALSFVLLLFWTPAVAGVDTPPLQILTPSIELSGAVGETVEQYVTVVANSALDAPVTAKVFIDASKVPADLTFPSTLKLTPAIPERFKISLVRARGPITADAQLVVYVNKGVQTTSKIAVKIYARPAFTVPVAPLSFKFTIVRKNGMSRWLASTLLPPKDIEPTAMVRIPEGGTGPIGDVSAEFWAIGASQGTVVTRTDYTLQPNVVAQTKVRNPVLELPVRLQLDRLPPDLYSGSLYFVANNVGSHTVPVNFSVRADPLLPVILLLLGILAGRFLRYMDGDGSRQNGFLDRIERVERRLSRGDADVLARAIAKAKRAAYDRRWAEAETLTGKIENRAEILIELDILDDGLDLTDAAQLAIQKDAEAARDALQRDDDISAGTLLNKIKGDLQQLGARTHQSTHDAISRSINITARMKAPQQLRPHTRAANAFSRIVGFSPLEAKVEFTRRIARPLIYVVLVIMLAYLGFRTLYMSSDTFGVGRISDYIGLVMWAISADVASKTLSSIRRVP